MGSPLSRVIHSQRLNAGPRVQGTDNSPIEVFIVVALRWWHLCHLETWRQGATSFPWTSEWPVRRDPVHHGEESAWRICSCPRRPCEEGRKQSDHKCLQEAHPHSPLPPLHLTPPPESEVWYSRLPPQQSWTDLQTGFYAMLVRHWRSVWRSTRGWWRAMISTRESPCMSKGCAYHQLAEARILGRETTEEEGFLKKSLRSTRENQWWTLMLVWFWIHRGSPLYAQRTVVTWPKVPHHVVQILCT